MNYMKRMKIKGGSANASEDYKYTSKVNCKEDVYKAYDEVLKFKDEDCSKYGLDDKAKMKFVPAAKLGYYLLKELAKCGTTIATTFLTDVFKHTALVILSHVLNIFSSGIFLLVKIAYYAVLCMISIYDGYKATVAEDQATKFGNALGYGIRIILILLGIARRRKYSKKLRRMKRMKKMKRMRRKH